MEVSGVGSRRASVATVGEHSVRKNHETVLRAAALLPGVHTLLCGTGEKLTELEALARTLGIADRTHFLGFRADVPALLKASDVFVFPSFQEGLPVAQMEAMAAGLPCVVSDVRGNNDLIAPCEGGMLEKPTDAKGFARDVGELLRSESMRARMGGRNLAFIKPYGVGEVVEQMAALYTALLGGTV